MSVYQEFKKFALRGNAIDMAVGIVIGAAFGKIISSLVTDIIMPFIGVITGGMDFSDLGVTIKAATETSEAIVIKYGLFINTIISFVLIAISVFLLIRQINKLHKKKETKPKATPEEILLLREIRDSLKK
ncbi:MAG: large-conductance mechanosensitive channel protein MscL [Bacteroidales bacterium]|nr:large-conductance mechanosensitive channel protein MscL [Bacteroidales bacterium]